MKPKPTILFLALCAVALTGCREQAQANAKTEPESGVSQNLKAERITRLNHSYIYFYGYNGGAYRPVNVIHDPDCPCHKTNSER